MNNISASIGIENLKFIDDLIQKHRNNAKIYDQIFKNSGLVIPTYKFNSISSHWVYSMIVINSKISRDVLIEKLNNLGIKAGILHVSNHKYTAAKSFYNELPGVEEFEKIQFNLPVGWWLNEEDIKYIGNTVLNICNSMV